MEIIALLIFGTQTVELRAVFGAQVDQARVVFALFCVTRNQFFDVHSILLGLDVLLVLGVFLAQVLKELLVLVDLISALEGSGIYNFFFVKSRSLIFDFFKFKAKN